jgi:uncharacterized membrane protein
MASRRNTDLVVVAVLSVIGALGVASSHLVVLRAIFALPLVLIYPGYAATAAIFAGQDLDRVKRIVLTVALSMAIVLLGAFVLEATPYGLRPASWCVLMLAVVLSTCFIAARRRGQTSLIVTRIRLRTRDAAILLCGLAVMTGTLIVGSVPLRAKNVSGYTALAMLTDKRSPGSAVVVDVVSGELRTFTFRLVVTRDTREVSALDVTLAPGQRWQRVVVVAEGPPKTARTIRATLSWFDHGASRYRSVRVVQQPAI